MAGAVPAEVWGEIFCLLPYSAIGNLARVCKRWRAVCTSDVFLCRRLPVALAAFAASATPTPPASVLTARDLAKRPAGEKAWVPPEPATLDQLLRACVHEPHLGVHEIVMRAWSFMSPFPISHQLLSLYASATSADERELVITLAARLGKVSPADLFRENYGLMCLMLSVASRQSPEAAALMKLAKGVGQRLTLERGFWPATPMDEPASRKALNGFVDLLLGKAPAKVIAEQLTVRSWCALSLSSDQMRTISETPRDSVHQMTGVTVLTSSLMSIQDVLYAAKSQRPGSTCPSCEGPP